MASPLQKLVDRMGDEEFAARFDVEVRTALAYRLGQRIPGREVAKRIVEGSSLTWAAIYSKEPEVNRGRRRKAAR